ncbi:hypothetical protein SAPIO_CDS0277 [Scedosporium apiospermum]|uniref:F-box domain-containing protein n=1 Tax=Pseudallescheria apiosperma TaxID=563466 RepID=A0A084GHW8_PSEDA|nr:uncharacterized protein SAPIO_CDS0277 [Scedosporium apiospermum]KEZ46930.1 hypothetical protein SAPIO_CDS0277 [Scedosporium apiospermum]
MSSTDSPTFFLNLYTNDLGAATAFYKAIGFVHLPVWSDEKSVSFTLPAPNDKVALMIHTVPRFKEFIRPSSDVADPKKATQALYSYSVKTKEEVDVALEKAVGAGGEKDPFVLEGHGEETPSLPVTRSSQETMELDENHSPATGPGDDANAARHGPYKLPPELVFMVRDFLPTTSRVAFALTSKDFLATLYPGGELPKLSEEETAEFLTFLERDAPGRFYCHLCQKLGRFDPSLEADWKNQEHGRCQLEHDYVESVAQSTQGLAEFSVSLTDYISDGASFDTQIRHLYQWKVGEAKRGGDWHRSLFDDDFCLSYPLAHLVMNRHLYGEAYGLPPHVLERDQTRTVSLGWKDPILDNARVGECFILSEGGEAAAEAMENLTLWPSIFSDDLDYDSATEGHEWGFRRQFKVKILDNNLYLSAIYIVWGPPVTKAKLRSVLAQSQIHICPHMDLPELNARLFPDTDLLDFVGSRAVPPGARRARVRQPQTTRIIDMWNYVRSFFAQPQTQRPPPSLVTITGIRFPADRSKPHLLSLTTTTDGVEDGPDCFWGHIPDFRDFWKTPQAWQWRDVETFRLEKQPLDSCNGLYVLFYSFDLESLPENRNFPVAIYGRERAFAGDAFVVKLKGNEIGSDLGEDGYALWDDVPSDILKLPVMKI